MGRQLVGHQRADIVATVGGQHITQGDLSSFQVGIPLTVGTVDAVMRLLQERDDRIVTNYASVNEENGLVHAGSIFLSTNVMHLLSADPTRVDIYGNGGAPAWTDVHRIYLPRKESIDDHMDDWSLVVIDAFDKCVYVFEPKVDVTMPVAGAEAILVNTVRDKTIALLANVFPLIPAAIWKYSRCPALHFKGQENDFDSAVFVIIAAYFLASDCPIAMKASYAARLRTNIAYWLLSETLLQ